VQTFAAADETVVAALTPSVGRLSFRIAESGGADDDANAAVAGVMAGLRTASANDRCGRAHRPGNALGLFAWAFA
jgi:hypothetical protein